MTDLSLKRERKIAARVFALFLKRFKARSATIGALVLLLALAALIIAVRQGVDLAWLVDSQSTDDAYVHADLIPISSHVAGYIVSIPVSDNERVRKGQLIVKIRDDDYTASFAKAEADLAAANAAVSVLVSQALVQRQKVTAAEALLNQANLELTRQKNLVGDGTTSKRELEAAQADRDAKDAELNSDILALQVIDRQTAAARELIKVKAAARDLAKIDLGYTRIVSPTDGQLSARIALDGQYVAAGTEVGLVVPLPDVWIVANFREAQLARMRVGQPASITVDSVPGYTFRGKVDSISPASGALQAVLPPDNATGNFTKVAQRFAVKIVMDPRQDGLDRLRPGMSSVVTVYTHDAGLQDALQDE